MLKDAIGAASSAVDVSSGQDVRILPLRPGFGAEVTGVNVAEGVSESSASLLRQALLDHQILLLRNQFLDEDQHIRFARIFGPLRIMWQAEHYRCANRLAHYLSNVDRSGAIVGFHPDPNSTHWHSDYSQAPIPAKATLMNAIRVPEGSGTTYFCNTYQLLDGLDPGTRERLAGYVAEHHMDFRRARRHGRLPGQWRAGKVQGHSIRSQIRWWANVFRRRWKTGGVYHPIVRPHPETGRPALFYGDHAWRIKGKIWPVGIRLMNQIHALEMPPETLYAHHWQAGDLLIWDNASLLHRLGEYDLSREVRIMRRSVILGAEQ
jgi:alpha-ketoglutarate-dependent taurine dioxygenase